MKLLITGGCGFIGTNLINHIHSLDYLNKSNIKIVVVDNLSTGHFIKGVHDKITAFHKEDICDTAIMQDIFEHYNFTHCIHLAGMVSIYDCNNDPKKAFNNNVIGAINIIELCKKNDVKLVAAETSAVYENSGLPPYSESQSNPKTIYAITKQSMSNVIKSYHDFYGLQYNCLRFFNVAGFLQDYNRTVPALHCGFIIRMIQNNPVIIFGDGNRRRDFIHVYDVCDFIINKCILTDEYNNKTFNLGTGKSTSLLEIREMIYDLYSIKERPEPIIMPEINGEAFDIYANIDEALATGWKPVFTMEDIITDTFDYITNEIEMGNIPENYMEDIGEKIESIKIGK